MKKQFKLDEIDCANCARELQDAVSYTHLTLPTN